MASGVKVSEDVKTTFQSVCMKSAKCAKKKFAVFKFSDDLKQIEVEKTCDEADFLDSDDEEAYNNLVGQLPPEDVRYVVYDKKYCNKDGTEKSDVMMVSWAPETAPIKKKMLCASSTNALKSSLGVSKNFVQGAEFGEVSSDALLTKLGGTKAAKTKK